MSGYVIAGYTVTLLTLALYAARVVWRERVLTRNVDASPPPGDQPPRDQPPGDQTWP